MSDPGSHVENVRKSAAMIRGACGATVPRVAIILGSGLGGLAARVTDAHAIDYAALPGFPQLTVAGHTSQLLVGRLDGVPVVVLQGRKHFYETSDPLPLCTMVRALHAAGVGTLFLSNAAGSLRAQIGVSELMLIRDHINYLGLNPLVGPNFEEFGPRFVSMSEAWDPDLRGKLKATATSIGVTLHEGVYMAFRGPSFETPSEIKMAQIVGADAVGMSSVPECIIARHCGMKVVGVSCITNMGAGLSDEQLSHAHTLANALRGADAFERLVVAAVKGI
ncbi:MAG TPA: purine-nucleoside phosphorylase [Opitutaceae bacterium]|nr:purine-nucleoside phosphorylase [Opitutaceae bacterium]